MVARPRLRRLAVSEGAGIFWLLLAGYLAVAIFLVFGANIIQGDALSRVGSATYILYSRDPHLAAIGFVWSPLPSLLMLPLLPFRIIFPQLVALGFASNIVSAVCMAGAVYQVWRILLDLRVTRTWRLLLTLLFALHPMIVFYGANGMSEAPFLFFLLLTVRYLAAWIHTSRIEWQVYAGLALGGAYLCRYEALPAGVGVLCVVTLVSWLRGKANRERRMVTALCDAAIVGAPFLLAVAVWAIASYVIVGHPFEQLASIYGNDSQMRTLAPGRQTTNLMQVLLQLVILEPFLLAAVAMGALKAARLRDLRVLAVFGVLAPILVFAVWAHLNGAVAPWLRYLIVAIPLGTLMAGMAFAQTDHPALMRTWLQKGLRTMRRVAMVTSLATAVVVSAAAMTDQSIAPEEGHELSYLTAGGRLTADQQRSADRFVTERAVAADLDRRHLAKGSVLVDTFLGYPIVLSSRHPDQFVITSDRDFRQAIADPSGTGVEYILIPSPSGLGNLDAINQTYKAMYASGAGMGILVQEFRNVGDGANWRLYGVTSSR